MSAQSWLIVSIIGFSLALVALIVAIFIFIKLNIRTVIGDLTGKTVARELKAMKEYNKTKGNKNYYSSNGSQLNVKVAKEYYSHGSNPKAMSFAHKSKRLVDTDKTDVITTTNQTSQKDVYYDNNRTMGLNNNLIDSTEVLAKENVPTVVLDKKSRDKISQAVVLSDDNDNIQSQISDSENPTDVLSSNDGKEIDASNVTTILNGTTVLNSESSSTKITPVDFEIVKSEIVIHTDEIIQ